jgi:hypothetical protein
MREKEIKDILNEGKYSWVKVEKFSEPSMTDPTVEWCYAYDDLMEHHIEETEFLINKCRELATYIKENNILI